MNVARLNLEFHPELALIYRHHQQVGALPISEYLPGTWRSKVATKNLSVSGFWQKLQVHQFANKILTMWIYATVYFTVVCILSCITCVALLWLCFQVFRRFRDISYLKARLSPYGLDGSRKLKQMSLKCCVYLIGSFIIWTTTIQGGYTNNLLVYICGHRYQDTAITNTNTNTNSRTITLTLVNIMFCLYDMIVCYIFYTDGVYAYHLLYGSMVSKYYGNRQLINAINNLISIRLKSPIEIGSNHNSKNFKNCKQHKHHRYDQEEEKKDQEMESESENENENEEDKEKEAVVECQWPQRKGIIRVLDGGCGNGMTTISLCHLFRNKFGINYNTINKIIIDCVDIWIGYGQSSTSVNSVLDNVKIEGLSEKYTNNLSVNCNFNFNFNIHTMDLRKLLFKNGTFDVVMSSLAMHNICEGKYDITSKLQRKKAVCELIRVLSPRNGILAIWGLLHANEYLQIIKKSQCLTDVQCINVSCAYTRYPYNYIITATKTRPFEIVDYTLGTTL